MKSRLRNLVSLTVLALLLFACGPVSPDRTEPSKDTTPQSSPNAVSNEGGEDETCLSSIPTYPGSQEEKQVQAQLEELVHTMETMSQASGGEVSVYITADVPGDVIQFYQKNAPRGGWERTMDLTSPEEGGIIVWEKGDFSAQMFVAVEEQDTVILLGCGPKLGSSAAATVPTFTEEDGLADNSVTAVAFAADGTAWVGTGGGVSRFDGETWTTYTPDDSLPGDMVTAVEVGADDTLWVSIDSFSYQGVARLDGPSWTTFDKVTKPNSISIAPDGTPWVSSCDTSDGGVYHFDGQNWTRYYKDNGLDNCVKDVAIASDGVIWAATKSSVARFDGSAWVNYTTADGLAGEPNAIAIDQNGTVWIGTDAGASRFDGQTWTTYTANDGLAGQTVRAIAVAPDSSVWFGTSGGVSRLKGTSWEGYSEQDGLPSNTVISISAAPDGRIWIGTAFDGVAVLQPSEES
ncbi:MAG: ligand-binding sensor domain-containing protein [Chloroflexota bacterium]